MPATKMGPGAEHETQVKPSGPKLETTADRMTSRKECAPRVYKHMTRRLWYFVHGDDHFDLGAEADHPWYREQVSKRVHFQARRVPGTAQHQKREVRSLHRVLIETC